MFVGIRWKWRSLAANKWQLFVIISRQFDSADIPKTWLICTTIANEWWPNDDARELSGKLTPNHILLFVNVIEIFPSQFDKDFHLRCFGLKMKLIGVGREREREKWNELCLLRHSMFSKRDFQQINPISPTHPLSISNETRISAKTISSSFFTIAWPLQRAAFI